MAGILKKLLEFLVLGRGPREGFVSIPSGTPEGLDLIYSATSSSEADMLRQVLADAGFHVEFVPSAGTGIFGTTGSSDIYVATTETKAAVAYLNEYLGTAQTHVD